MSFRYLLFTAVLLCCQTAYSTAQSVAPKRIITLSGALTETVAALGYGNRIVATDVTSIYPDLVKKIPKVSRNRALSAESLASFFPDLVLAPEGDVSRELRYQLKTAGIRLVTFRQEYSTAGAERFIAEVAEVLNNRAKGQELVQKLRRQLEVLRPKISGGSAPPLKVLFIYARGTGTMTVAGRGSSMASIIALAGGTNAVKEFTEFKPYSAEMLVRANPDVVLMFDFGLSSLGGTSGVLDLPGMAATKAGRNKRIVQMDGQLLINFSVRLPEAMEMLYHNLYLKP